MAQRTAAVAAAICCVYLLQLLDEADLEDEEDADDDYDDGEILALIAEDDDEDDGEDDDDDDGEDDGDGDDDDDDDTLARVLPPNQRVVRPLLHRNALLTPSCASVSQFLADASDLDFSKFIRLDRSAFALLLERFRPHYENARLRPSEAPTSPVYRPHRRLGRRALTTEQALLVLLRHLAGGVAVGDLCTFAGTTSSSSTSW